MIDLILMYFEKLSTTKLNLGILIPYSAIMLFIYINRLIFVYNAKKEQKELTKEKWGFTVGHIITQFIISYVIGWSIILLTFSDDSSLFINYIIAPLVGFTLGIYIDNKYMLPLNSIYTKKKSDKKSSGSDNETNININIGNNMNDSDQQDKTINNEECIISKVDTIDKEIIGSDSFEETLINTVNSIILSQKQQCAELYDQSEKIKNNTAILDALRDSEMINKKIELKKMIHLCLNQGYAKPNQNEKITLYYQSYVNLGGNGEIESLYKEHYLKLQVHEDRRKRREPQKYYDEFDDVEINNDDFNE
jgi:hypothetical protein